MPFVRVSWFAGTSQEQKREVAKGITEVISKLGIPPEATQVVFEDVPRDSWSLGGTLAADRK